jgi:cell division protease FtsH
MITTLARKMVCEWGMSEKMGPLSYGKKEEQIFLGREFATHEDYSEETAKNIDAEVMSLVMRNYEKSKSLLNEHIDILHKIAKELLEKEVLSGEEIDALIGDHLPKPVNS